MPIRLLTYNIHSALGRDGKRDFARIGRFLKSRSIDIALLQEVETRRFRAGMPPEDVLRQLQTDRFPHAVTGPTVRDADGGWFGNVILSRFPVIGHAVIDTSFAGREPRNIIDARLRLPDGTVFRAVNTHKGLSRIERRSQLARLESLLAQEPDIPLAVGGDINEWYYASGSLRKIHVALHPCPVKATFPVACPVIHLDRVWCRPAALLIQARRLKSEETKIYSDHYPVLAEFGV